MALQVFEMNDIEWWAGDGTPEEMLAAYMEFTGCSHEESTGDVDELPRPLSEEEMDALKFSHDDNGNRLAEPETFREHLAKMVANGEEFPCLFAATDD